MVFNLDSVGSVIDSNDGIVYPKLCDGEYDVLCGTHLSEVDIEWINGLSSSDREFLDFLFDIDNESESAYWEMKAELHYGI
tara:strand:- start:422 stop:664 length:243 start_codon:yes stop_codon:yes gene_type:complete